MPDDLTPDANDDVTHREEPSFFDSLPAAHREALFVGLGLVAEQCFDAAEAISRGERARDQPMFDELPARWRGRYDARFFRQLGVCAIVLSFKLRAFGPRCQVTSCVGEALALRLAIREAEVALTVLAEEQGGSYDPDDDWRWAWVEEYANTEHWLDVLYLTGQDRPREAELAPTAGIWGYDLRYRSLFRSFEGISAFAPVAEADADWFRTATEPEDDVDDAPPAGQS
jgi:hypothetical protein